MAGVIKDACDVLKSRYYIGAKYFIPDCASDRDMIRWFNFWFFDHAQRELLVNINRFGLINLKPNGVHDENK